MPGRDFFLTFVSPAAAARLADRLPLPAIFLWHAFGLLLTLLAVNLIETLVTVFRYFRGALFWFPRGMTEVLAGALDPAAWQKSLVTLGLLEIMLLAGAWCLAVWRDRIESRMKGFDQTWRRLLVGVCLLPGVACVSGGAALLINGVVIQHEPFLHGLHQLIVFLAWGWVLWASFRLATIVPTPPCCFWPRRCPVCGLPHTGRFREPSTCAACRQPIPSPSTHPIGTAWERRGPSLPHHISAWLTTTHTALVHPARLGRQLKLSGAPQGHRADHCTFLSIQLYLMLLLGPFAATILIFLRQIDLQIILHGHSRRWYTWNPSLAFVDTLTFSGWALAISAMALQLGLMLLIATCLVEWNRRQSDRPVQRAAIRILCYQSLLAPLALVVWLLEILLWDRFEERICTGLSLSYHACSWLHPWGDGGFPNAGFLIRLVGFALLSTWLAQRAMRTARWANR